MQFVTTVECYVSVTVRRPPSAVRRVRAREPTLDIYKSTLNCHIISYINVHLIYMYIVAKI